ncbi:MAG: serine threonine rich antigen, partial [bacterium]
RRLLSFIVAFGLSFAPTGGSLWLPAETAWATVPWMINYQGRLTDSSGKAVSGSYAFKFRLYDALTSGTKQWEESQTVTLIESDNGVFSVVLGSSTVLTSVDFNTPMWLSVQVDSDSEMTPRQRLTIDSSSSGKLTITRAGTALVITPSSAPSASTKMIDVQNTSGTTKFSVDYEGDVTVAGDLAVTGTVSGSTSITGTTGTTWTIDSDNTSGTEPASGAGLVVEGGSGDASFLWDATNDELDINKSVNISGTLSATNITSSGTTLGDVTAVGDITSGAAFTATDGADGTALYFEGSTSDGYEVALTSANPTSDITVTLPATTGTVITTGDSGTVTAAMLGADSVATSELADFGTLTATSGRILVADGTDFESVAM